MATANEGAGNRSMLDWALWYSRKGFCVIPCHPKTKEPIPKWREYGKKLPTEKQVRAWWTENTDANIAIILGGVSNLIALEIDDPAILGGHEIPRTPQAISGGKRLPHIYFRYVEGMRNHKEPEKEKGTGKGEKFSIRGDGQYIIVPPSTHPKGGRYEWAKGLGIHEVEIVDPPDWVLELIKENPAKEEAESFFKKRDSNFDDGLRKYVEELKSKVRLSDLLIHLDVERTESNSKYIQFNCPFHNSEGKKSFTAWDEIGVGKDWHDEKNYDCIGFVEAHQNLGFIDALNFLAEYAGLEHYRPKISVTEEVSDALYGKTDKELIPQIEFPFDVFEPEFRGAIERIGDVLPVTREVVASIALCLASGAIGKAIKVCRANEHEVAPFLWLMVIARSGYGKTPAEFALFKPIQDMHAANYQKYKEEIRKYARECRSAKQDPSFDVGDEPQFERLFVSDITTEALGKAFESSPRGLISYQDEVASLILGLNQYKGGAGNDRQFYISLFDCVGLQIDRKSGGRYVPNTGLAIVGGIQPKMLPRVFDPTSFDDGLLPRFLFVSGENKPIQYADTRKGIDKEDRGYWSDFLKWCYSFRVQTDRETGVAKSKLVYLREEEQERWGEFFDEYTTITGFLSERAQVFIPKMMTYGLKFMGILHVLKAYSDSAKIGRINEINEINVFLEKTTIEKAIKLTRYFTGQAINILDLYNKSQDSQLDEYQQRVIRTIYSLRGEVSNGQLLFSRIVDTYNDGLPKSLQLSSIKIGYIVKKLGLSTHHSTDNMAFLKWEEGKLNSVFSKLNSQTCIPRKDVNFDNPINPTSIGEVRPNIHSDTCDCEQCVPSNGNGSFELIGSPITLGAITIQLARSRSGELLYKVTEPQNNGVLRTRWVYPSDRDYTKFEGKLEARNKN